VYDVLRSRLCLCRVDVTALAYRTVAAGCPAARINVTRAISKHTIFFQAAFSRSAAVSALDSD